MNSATTHSWKTHGAAALLLFVVTEKRQLKVNSADEPLKPVAGETVIALVPSAQSRGITSVASTSGNVRPRVAPSSIGD